MGGWVPMWAEWPLIPQNEAAGLAPFTALTFYGPQPPFQVNWRSAHTDPLLADQQRLVAPGPTQEEIAQLNAPPEEPSIVEPDDFVTIEPTADVLQIRTEAEASADVPEDAFDDEGDDDAMPEDFNPGDEGADAGDRRPPQGRRRARRSRRCSRGCRA